MVEPRLEYVRAHIAESSKHIDLAVATGMVMSILPSRVLPRRA